MLSNLNLTYKGLTTYSTTAEYSLESYFSERNIQPNFTLEDIESNAGFLLSINNFSVDISSPLVGTEICFVESRVLIYDENENKLNVDEYDNVYEFIPLLNINGVHFSRKGNFTIEIILTPGLAVNMGTVGTENIL